MKNRKLWVSILAGVMAAIMLVSLIFSILPSVVSAKSSSEIRKEIDKLKQEQEQIREELSDLQSQQDDKKNETLNVLEQKDAIDRELSLLYSEIENINAQIQVYSDLIAEKQNELDAAMKEYEDLIEKNRDRIRAMEEGGKISYWSVIFQASSFSDLLDRLNMVDEIAAADQRRLDALDEAANAVAQARGELAKERESLEVTKAELVGVQEELDAKRREADELLQELKEQSDELKDLYDAAADAEAALADDIAQREKEFNEAKRREEEERRRQEEEERRRQEEQNKNNNNNNNNNDNDNNNGGSNNGDSGNTGTGGDGGSETEKVTWRTPCSYSQQIAAFGWRIDPLYGDERFHNGVDLAGSQGTAIYATRSGTVTTATFSGSYGNYVVINHGDGYSSLYGHMTHYVVSAGQTVTQGQVIGYMGSTGWTDGTPHLHFGISLNGSWVNPRSYI